MASSYTDSLRLVLPVQGELTGTWGDVVNAGLTYRLDEAIAGTATVSMTDANYTLSTATEAADEARQMFIKLTGTLTAQRNVVCPSKSKLYFAYNNTSGGYGILFKTAAGSGVVVPNGKQMALYCDGTNVFDAFSQVSSLVLSNALGVASGGTGATTLTGIVKGNGTGAFTAAVSGTDFKTINSTSILGSGDIAIQGGISYSKKTSNYTASSQEGLIADTSGGAFTITLPSGPSVGAYVYIADGADWGTNNLTVGRNGSTIEGLAEDMILDIQGAAVQFIYDGTTWEIFAQIGGAGGQAVTLTGTQTLTNKTIDYNSNTLLNLPSGSIIRSARTSNTILGTADKSTLIDITSGTFTQTFDACATLGSGWYCYIRNSGTGDITLDPNASETIDGLTSFVMYPSEVRLVQCDGTALRTVVIQSFNRTFTATGTFTKPPGYAYFAGIGWGGGASGLRSGSTSANVGGGGGGGSFPFQIAASKFGATETITVGAGGGPSTTGSYNAGGDSSIGSMLVFVGATSNAGGGFSTGTVPVGFEGSNGNNSNGTGVYGGGASNPSPTANSTGSRFGGGGGGGCASGGVAYNGGASLHGGNGGNASSASNGADGSAPGGGGGATQTGTQSGAGARGEVRIWGII